MMVIWWLTEVTKSQITPAGNTVLIGQRIISQNICNNEDHPVLIVGAIVGDNHETDELKLMESDHLLHNHFERVFNPARRGLLRNYFYLFPRARALLHMSLRPGG